MKQAIAEAGNFSSQVTLRGALRALLDTQTDGPISESTVTRLLDRTAPKIVAGANATKLQQLTSALARKWRAEEFIAAATDQPPN